MRIGFGYQSVLDRDGSEKKIDGIGTYAKNLCQEMTGSLQQDGSEINYYQFGGVGKKGAVKRLLVHDTGDNFFPNPYWYSYVPGGYDTITRESDIFHAPDYMMPRLDIPVVATLHDAIKLKNPEYARDTYRDLKNYLMCKHARSADHIISISQSIVGELVEYFGVDESKISVVHNGIDDTWFNHVNSVIQKFIANRYGIDKSYVLTVGTLQPRKNFERMIDAFSALPKDTLSSAQLVIVGNYGWDCDALVEKIKKAEEQGLVKWLRYIPTNDLQILYQGAEAVLFMSMAEGFGLPAVEGFASRSPVVASDIPPVREVTAGAALLADPYDVADITEKLDKVLTDSAYAQTLREKGFSRAKELSWQNCAESTYAVYKKVIEG